MRNLILGTTLLGMAFRTPGLFANTFHADEALFASFARRIAVWRDPLLAGVSVDKPPLAFYLQALFYPLQGPVTWAARLPNWIASILLIPLTWLLVRRLVPHNRAAAAVAALLVAFSPLAIQFAPTAFLDPLLIFWLMLALNLALRAHDRGGSAVVAGLALWTKYQAILFLPLIVFFWWRGRPSPPKFMTMIHWLLIFGSAGLALIGWDVARAGRWTLWQAQMSGFGGLRLIWSWEVWPRLIGWSKMSGWVFGVGWVSLAVIGWVAREKRQAERSKEKKKEKNEQQQAVGQWLTAIVLWLWGYFLLHWLLAIPVWDRYWLPLVPLGAVAITLAFALAGEFKLEAAGGLNSLWSGLLIIVLLLPQGWLASRGTFPVGGRPDADGGAQSIAAYLEDKPYGTVLYDHDYSWQWRYYFFDRGVFVSWFPTPLWFGRELQAFAAAQSGERFVVLPSGARGHPVRREAERLGFELVLIAAGEEMSLYKINDGY